MTTPEGKIKDKVKARFANMFPGCYRFMPVQNGMGAPALDMYFCIHGLFVGIETKRPPTPGRAKPKPTERQKQTMQDIERAGGMAFLVYDDATIKFAIDKIIFFIGEITE